MNYLKQEKGQALVFVIATMTVALAVGVGVSVRNLASISRTSRSDTYSRAQAAAEGGAENVLARSDEDLAAMVGAPAETITFAPADGDEITAVADVIVADYNIPADLNYLPLEISAGSVSEVRLNGGNVDVCWSGSVEGFDSDIYYIAYNDSGDSTRVGVESSSREGLPSGYNSNFESPNSGRDSFASCTDISLPSSATKLRILAMNNDISAGVYPDSGVLPNQGYLITSVGRLLNFPQGDDSEVAVQVTRSFPYLPAAFDFAIFSGSTTSSLD